MTNGRLIFLIGEVMALLGLRGVWSAGWAPEMPTQLDEW